MHVTENCQLNCGAKVRNYLHIFHFFAVYFYFFTKFFYKKNKTAKNDIKLVFLRTQSYLCLFNSYYTRNTNGKPFDFFKHKGTKKTKPCAFNEHLCFLCSFVFKNVTLIL